MAIKIGDKAPAFSLLNTDLEKVSLSDYNGQNLLVLFFPLAFTSVCTEELCQMRDQMKVYEDLDTSIVAISVDSPFTLGQFKKAQDFNFPLLSDFNKEVARAYGAYYEQFVLDLQGVAKRAAFVVDKEGVVQYAEVLEDAKNIPDFQAIKSSLQSL